MDRRDRPSRVCIVGHGPSLQGSNLGELIDRHTVIRLKNGQHLRGPDYGTRTDFIVARGMESSIPFRAPVFSDVGWPFYQKYQGPVKLSIGLRALLIVCDILQPRSVVLAGFDAVKSGDNRNYRGANNYDIAPHDFAREQSLVTQISTDYGVPITYL